MKSVEKENFKTDIQNPTNRGELKEISGFSITNYFYFDSFPSFFM